MTAGAPPVVGVVTVSYSSADVLDGFLASVPGTTAVRTAVVVVDNNPADGERVRELARRASAQYLPLPANPGYGGAMNAGVAMLPPGIDWILISNPDIVLAEGAVDRMIAVGESSPDIGAVGPLVVTDGTPYPSAREVPSLSTGIGHALFGTVWKNNRWTRRYHAGDAYDAERDAGWLSGSCLLVRKAAFEAVGGFDEGYFMYFEDVDLGYRLGRAGWRNRFAPGAVVEHTGGHSTERESATMTRAHHASAYRFLAQKYSGWAYAPVRLALRAALLVRSRLHTGASRDR